MMQQQNTSRNKMTSFHFLRLIEKSLISFFFYLHMLIMINVVNKIKCLDRFCRENDFFSFFTKFL